jgi:two-component system response regulator BaeR
MTSLSALIIEDDPDLSSIFAEALGTAGYETEVILDGQAALDRLADVNASVIVLDLHLPNVSGQTILEHIRSDARFEKTRVIVTTADAVMAELLRDQADFVLIKPISFGQLRDLASRLKASFQ